MRLYGVRLLDSGRTNIAGVSLRECEIRQVLPLHDGTPHGPGSGDLEKMVVSPWETGGLMGFTLWS